MIKLGDEVIHLGHFPDNSLHMTIPTFDSWTINWYYENDAELFALICLRKKYEGIGMKLYMPYCPHARQDRVKRAEDVFTLKYFCEVINSLNFDEVTIVDPHSKVCVELLNNVKVIEPTEKINKVYNLIDEDNQNLCYFYPDAGAFKRYWPLIEKTGNCTYGIKDRDWVSGRIKSFEIENPEVVDGKNVLIIDDICSYGGTFVYAAQALHDAGAKNIYLYITHCEDNIFKGKIFEQGLIKKVFTTNSIYYGNDERIIA